MKIIKSGIRLHKVVLDIITSHSFIVITLAGNLIILGSSYLFFFLEYGKNQSIQSFLDAVWWGFATATTVGYGDIVPITVPGKILGILLMLMGTALFAMYTALFAQSIMEDELLRFNKKD
ncbi:MAG: two pore domain potassium channel family protein [Bacteriovoracaceae bacterium]|nr:two pore domain potassium channel family protein [Bacteriovoracaceae bacterium]